MKGDALLTSGLEIELGGQSLPKELEALWLWASLRCGAWAVNSAEIAWRDPECAIQAMDLLAPGTALRLRCENQGTGGEGRRWTAFDGEVTGGELRIEPGRVPVWVTHAQGLLHRLNQKKHSRNLPEGSLHSHLNLLVAEEGWPIRAPQLLLPAFFQQNRSNWATLRLLARRLGLMLYMDKGTLVLTPPGAGTPWQLTPELRLDSIQVTRPLLATPTRVSAWDPSAATPVASREPSRPATPHFLQSPMRAHPPAAPQTPQTPASIEHNTTVSILRASRLAGVDDANLTSKALSNLRSMTNPEIQLQSSAPHPLKPGTPVDSGRLAPAFQGNWWVEELSYHWGSEGSRMEVRGGAAF